jgi:ligand-binding sensor domain-containing protein
MKRTTLLIILFFATSCYGQSKLIKNHFTNQFQAAADNVHCALQDKAGNLWFGTTGDGVYRYDGQSFANFTTKDGLSSNTVWSILEDKAGNIWIGTNAGLCRYSGKNITRVSMTVSNNILFTNTVNTTSKNEVFSIMQAKNGTLWFGTTDGVYYYNGKSFTRFLDNFSIINGNGLSLKSVQCMLEDKNGNIWFGSGPMAFEGICLYNGKILTNFKPKNEGWIRNIIESKNGTILFATRHIGVYIYDGKTFLPFTKPTEIANDLLNTILEDKAGNIWYASDYAKDINDDMGGVWKFDRKTFVRFTKKEGLTNTSAFLILEDKSGHIWIGTRNTGLYRYDGKTLMSFSK